MSTMPATSGHSEACCNLPPIVTEGYEAKGAYEEIGGYKTYVTGPDDAELAIVIVYDIFGYFPQTLQGADILATSDRENKYKVYMPDLFHDNPADISWYPPDNEAKQNNLGAFFQKNPPSGAADAMPLYANAIKQGNPKINRFALLGFCWGGKVVALTADKLTNPFSVLASVHPAMIDPKDAEAITVPFIMLASGDEPEEDVKKFDAALTVPKHVERFDDQIHGWMAARSNLSDDRVKAEYERGYSTLLKFFGTHMN